MLNKKSDSENPCPHPARAISEIPRLGTLHHRSQRVRLLSLCRQMRQDSFPSQNVWFSSLCSSSVGSLPLLFVVIVFSLTSSNHSLLLLLNLVVFNCIIPFPLFILSRFIFFLYCCCSFFVIFFCFFCCCCCYCRLLLLLLLYFITLLLF